MQEKVEGDSRAWPGAGTHGGKNDRGKAGGYLDSTCPAPQNP